MTVSIISCPRFLDDTPKSDNDFVDYKPIPNFRPGEGEKEFDTYINSKAKEIIFPRSLPFWN